MNNRHNKKTGIFKSIALLASVASLSACGGFKNDPTDGFHDVIAASQVPHAVPTHDQKLATYTFFVDIEAVDAQNTQKSVDALEFRAGQPATYYVQAWTSIPEFVFALNTPTGLPNGVKFEPRPGAGANSFVISGTPVSTSCEATASAAQIRFTFTAGNNAGVDPARVNIVAQGNPFYDVSQTFVSSGSQPPKIIKNDFGKAVYKEGVQAQFSVVVDDGQRVEDPNDITLYVTGEKNFAQEILSTRRADGGREVIGRYFTKSQFTVNPAERQADGKWLFKVDFFPQTIPVVPGETAALAQAILSVGDTCSSAKSELVPIEGRVLPAKASSAKTPLNRNQTKNN